MNKMNLFNFYLDDEDKAKAVDKLDRLCGNTSKGKLAAFLRIQIKNKLGIIISTKYPKVGNPFDNEVQYAKNVLDNITKDETLFALLYEPDSIKENEWKKGNKHIYQANPITLEMPAVFDELKKEQKRAITDPAFTGTFLCKQLNIHNLYKNNYRTF